MCERRNVYKNPFSIARGLPVSVKRIGEFIRRQVALVSNRFTEVKPLLPLVPLPCLPAEYALRLARRAAAL